MKAGFVYGENAFEIFDFVRYAEGPFNSEFKLKIVSGDFMGVAPCCSLMGLDTFISELEEMYRFERKVVEFDDMYYGDKILFELNNVGHINVSGKIYGEHAEQSLEFTFDIDQTVIPDFCTELHALVDCVK